MLDDLNIHCHNMRSHDEKEMIQNLEKEVVMILNHVIVSKQMNFLQLE